MQSRDRNSYMLYRLSEWQWWVSMIAAYERTDSPGWQDWSKGGQPLVTVLLASNELGECNDAVT